MANRSRTSLVFLASWMLATVLGCSSLTGGKRTEFQTATPQNPAIKCLCLWQQAEGVGPEGRQCRGFAGQIFFFGSQSEVPLVVHGDVKVFVFDDSGTEVEQTRPVHQTAFNDAEWQTTLTSTQFGPAYNVFVPYPSEGHYEANCALRLRLTRPDGRELFSDMAEVKLAGSVRKSIDQPQPTGPRKPGSTLREERQASRQAETGIRTTTIGVERDGQMFRPTDRIRKIQIGPVDALADDDAQAAEINELETKLQRLRAAGQIRQIGHEQE